MSKAWPLVKLGEVLSQEKRSITVLSDNEYNLLGAHWYAKGLYIKDIKYGSQIKASSLYRVHEGDFVYNRLFAWKGSFAIATKENNGCFVSNEFPCFHVSREKVEPQYLRWYFSRESSWNEALGLSYGATPTSRNRLNEEHLLNITIPLPPLAEQQRIVATIGRLAGKIEEAITHKKEIVKEYSSMLHSIFNRLTKDSPMIEIEKIAPLIRRAVNVCMEEECPELGIKSFGKGTFHKPALNYKLS